VREEAIRAIGPRSLTFGVYVWLAYRLHSLPKATPVTWLALHKQFGGGFKLLKQFKPSFREALQVALAVYPEADVDVARRVLYCIGPRLPSRARTRVDYIWSDDSDFTDRRGHELGRRPSALMAPPPAAGKSLVERGLTRLDTSRHPPRLFFYQKGDVGPSIRDGQPRLADPEKFAHIRRELGLERGSTVQMAG
jgi:hypothetical protein